MMKKIYVVFLALFFAALAGIGILSFCDQDQAVSLAENRTLTQAPALNAQSLLYEGYTTRFETYYADQFPFREALRSCNRTMNRFYYYAGAGGSNMLVIGFTSQAETGGEALTQAAAPAQEPQQTTQTPTQTPAEPDTSDEPVAPYVLDLQAPPEPDPAAEPEAVTDPAAEPEAVTDPAAEPEAVTDPAAEPAAEPEAQPAADPNAVFQDGSILIVGDRAMDVPYATYSLVADYAAVLSELAADLGAGVNVYSLLAPNAAAFYAPDSFQTGNYDQSAMFSYAYSQMQGVTTVDAYSALSGHTDEYIYFRTDHHWTALGAYYAYRAFCQAKGLTPVELSAFQTGRYTGFLGSLYGYTSAYPQSQALADNPDYVDYYLPVAQTTCTYYADATLTNGGRLPVVSTNLSDTVSNKYLCFVGGDFPIECIETDVSGPVCIVLKESYGNAFVPFLTSHYSKIYLVDPREFNHGDDDPLLNLKEFSTRVGATDVIVLNYPFMVTNESYIRWLDYLVNTPVREPEPADEAAQTLPES